MVRINIINPKYLSDQHIIAEYDEMLMLEAYIRRYPKGDVPPSYRLGEGHMKFFRDKCKYLNKRHKLLREEMKKRGFNPKKSFRLSSGRDWRPSRKDKDLIKKRILDRLMMKPSWYRYRGENKNKKFWESIIQKL